MKKLLNTLFVTTDGAYLRKEGESVLVKIAGETKLRLPIHNLAGIICLARVICSPALLALCAGHGVAVSFISKSGRFLARVQGPTSGNVLLRREQYRRASSLDEAVEIARSMVLAKTANCRVSLLRAAREQDDPLNATGLEDTATKLNAYMKTMKTEKELERLRGLEGYASRSYFNAFKDMIVAQKQDFVFSGRSRRPPRDSVNALLSFVYTLLLHDSMSALESVGLDPQVGFLHRDRPGRPSLALDLMEELRPVLADRLVLTLINLRQVQQSGFRSVESGGILMDDETRKTVVLSYQKRKQDEIEHPFLGEKIPFGMVLYAQSLLLARFLRGEMDGYPPFFWR